MALKATFKIEGVGNVIAALITKSNQHKTCHAQVGFTAPHAVYVHEAVGMKLKGIPRPAHLGGTYWSPAGQAKFLEEPSKTHADEIRNDIRQALASGQSLEQAVMRGGEKLLSLARARVPIVTGELWRSGYVRLRSGGGPSMRSLPMDKKGAMRQGQGTRRQGIYGNGRKKKS